MSVLKQLTAVLVDAMKSFGISYLSQTSLLQAIKDDSAPVECLFHALIDLLLQVSYGFSPQHLYGLWDSFNYTLADFVFFLERELRRMGYPFFLSRYPIKQIKQPSFLYSKALFSALLFVLVGQAAFEEQLSASTVQARPEDPLYAQGPPCQQEPRYTIQHLSVLYYRYRFLVREIADYIKLYQPPLQKYDRRSVVLTFTYKLLNKMMSELAGEQEYRFRAEKYEIAAEGGDKAERPAQSPCLERPTPQGLSEMNYVNRRFLEIVEWVKDEFWME